jgi:N-methylhydantoinase A
VPPGCGLFSAVGLLVADPQYDLVRAYTGDIGDVAALEALFAELETEIADGLVDDGYERHRIEIARSADMRYAGQTMRMRVPVPDEALTPELLDVVLDRLEAEHVRTFGHRRARLAASVELARVRASVRGDDFDPSRALAAAPTGTAGTTPRPQTRDAYCGRDHGVLATPIIGRHDLDATRRPGPFVIEEMDATIVIPPEAHASLDRLGNVEIGWR